MSKKMVTKSVGSNQEHGVAASSVLRPDERVIKCGKMIQAALEECGCQLYTALKVGNAESPLLEIGGFPIVVKITTNDTPTNGSR